MILFSYTYSVVRYSHDPGAGEKLNIGIVMFSPEARFLKSVFQHSYERLSKTFSGFNGDQYKRTIKRFEYAIEKLAEQWTEGMFVEFDRPKDVSAVTTFLWPDSELSYANGPILCGTAEDLDDELASIFDRMVTSQYDQGGTERRTDEEVWSVYHKSFLRASITRVLQPKTFVTEAFEVKFEHSFKNGAWHALQPISLDYTKPEGMKNKVTKLLGSAVVLEDNIELDTLYLLLGPPNSSEHLPAYRRAKELLRKRIKVKHQIIEEDQADRFAESLAQYMKEHGVLEMTP